MPIQGTDFFNRARAVGQDIASIPGSISQGAQAGAQLGLLFDKFKKAEQDQKLFQNVKSDFIKELRSDLAEDPRLEKALRLAGRAQNMQQLTGMATEYTLLKDAEARNSKEGGTARWDAGMLGVQGAAKLFSQNAEKQRTRSVGTKAQERMSEGVKPEALSPEQFKQVEPQVKYAAQEAHRKRMQELAMARNKLLKAKTDLDAGRQARMDRFEALKVTQQARLGIDMSNDAIGSAQKNYQKISESLVATDEDKQKAYNAVQDARDNKTQWETLLKVGQELLKEDKKFRDAQKKIEEDKKRTEGGTVPALLQTPALQSPYADLLGFNPLQTPRRLQASIPQRSVEQSGSTSFASKRGTGF